MLELTERKPEPPARNTSLLFVHGAWYPAWCWDGQLPVHRQLLVRTVLVPAAQLPQPDQLSPWLEQTWTQVDAWVAGHTDHS